MSDDEAAMGPTGGMGDDFENDMGDEDEGEPITANDLPEGITKEILTPAPSDSWKKPRAGDEVTVHYVGTLQADGSEFDSSRSREKPFVFILGRGNVIKGWDLGVATMKKGEVAKFTLAPEFAYGDSGSPPKIPGGATLIFEIELISWMAKDDLFGDDGVVKTTVKEGSGYKMPKNGEEVVLSLKVEDVKGSVIEEKCNLEYILGSGKLGSIGRVCDKALESMKKAEEVSLKCSKDYAYDGAYPDGVTVCLTLQQIYETVDVSFSKDKSVMKKQIHEGEGYDRPKDGSKVKLAVVAASDGTSPIPTFVSKTLEFKVGYGEVCDALEWVVAEMKTGERAIVTVSQSSRAAESQLGLKDVSADKVVMTIELIEFEAGKNQWDLSEEEKVELGATKKEVGGDLFKRKRFEMALQRYKNAADLFGYIDNFKEENKHKATELKKVCELNKAACYLQLKDYEGAKKSCELVLKDDTNNVKAVYRRAQAHCGLKDFRECIQDCKRVVELDPQNKDVRTLLQQARAGQKADDQKSKGLFANMCKALGTGPIPEPYKVKHGGMNDEYDDEDMPPQDEEALTFEKSGDISGEQNGDSAEPIGSVKQEEDKSAEEQGGSS